MFEPFRYTPEELQLIESHKGTHTVDSPDPDDICAVCGVQICVECASEDELTKHVMVHMWLCPVCNLKQIEEVYWAEHWGWNDSSSEDESDSEPEKE